MRKKGKKKSYTSIVANDLVIVVPKCTYLLPHKTSTPSLVNSKATQIKIKERNYKDRLRSRRFIQGVTQLK
jgi:hypothetical protein